MLGPGDRSGDDPAREIRERALALLARREHARTELAAKLRARGYDPEDVDGVLGGLERAGQLSDERFAEQFVRVHAARGDGPLKIRYALEGKGVVGGVVDRALEAAAEDWRAHAVAAREKRFGPDSPSAVPEQARQSRFLERRGFTAEQVRHAVGRGARAHD